MKNIIGLFCLSLFSINSLADEAKFYDSLSTVLSTSTNKSDFNYADSVINELNGEYNYIQLQKLIFIGKQRSKELNFEYYLARFAFRESIINTIRGDIGNAMKLAGEALVIFKKQNAIDAAGCYNTMGSMVANQGDIKKGLNYLEKAFEITARFKNHPKYKYLMCNHFVVTGYIHILNEDYAAAEPYLKDAIELSSEIDHISTQIYALLNMAKISKFNEEFDQAFETLEQAMEIAKFHQQIQLICLVNIHYADTYFAMGKLKEALNYYKIAEKITLTHLLKRRSLEIYDKIIQIHLTQNNYKAAAEYQEKYITLLKELQLKERETRQLMHEVQFEVSDKNEQINSLAVQKKIELEKKESLQRGILIITLLSLLIILIIVLIFNRIRSNRRLEAERLKKDIALHQMTALKSQMNPHFTFNALTSIQDLILKNKTDASYGYITKFANLVRSTLNHSNQEFIPIEDEIRSLQLYLELEKLRFKDDLTINFDTNKITGVELPPLIIQPFIENALKHGLLHKDGTKILTITFKLTNVLTCIITDNGIGRKESAIIQNRRKENHQSFAINSIESRFELFRKLYDFDLGIKYIDKEIYSDSIGTSVILTLPFRRNF